MADCCSDGVDLSLKNEHLYGSLIISQVVLSRIWLSVGSIHDDADANNQERYQCRSHKSMLFSILFEVGDILDGF